MQESQAEMGSKVGLGESGGDYKRKGQEQREEKSGARVERGQGKWGGWPGSVSHSPLGGGSQVGIT